MDLKNVIKNISGVKAEYKTRMERNERQHWTDQKKKPYEKWASLALWEPPQLQWLFQPSSDDESVCKLHTLVATHWQFLNFKNILWLWPTSFCICRKKGDRKTSWNILLGKNASRITWEWSLPEQSRPEELIWSPKQIFQEHNTLFNYMRIKCTERESWTITSTYTLSRK